MTSPNDEVFCRIPIHVLMRPHVGHTLHDLALEVDIVVRKCKYANLIEKSEACVRMSHQFEEPGVDA